MITHATFKFELALELVARFHDDAAAATAKESFINRFRNNLVPDDMPEFVLSCGETGEVGIAHCVAVMPALLPVHPRPSV